MSQIKLRLTGCERYNFKGELYVKGKVYLVGEAKAKILMRKEDAYGRPFFSTYVAPQKSRTTRIADLAAVALAEATAAIEAEEDAVVDRPDGSEPEEEEEVSDDVDQPEEVDKDDDPELDNEDDDNPEEIEVEDEEDEDRNDGSAVEV